MGKSWWNPFDWVDTGLDAAQSVWDDATDIVGGMLAQAQGAPSKAGKTPTATQEVISTATESLQGAVTVVKGTTRVASTALDFPMQVLNNANAFAYNNPYLRATLPFPQVKKGFKQAEASTLEQAAGIIGNTTLFQLAKDAIPGGDEVDLGSGYFSGGETVRQVNERKKELYPQIYGSSWTPGRTFAGVLADSGVTEPGSTMYNAISGSVDVGWTLAADPVNFVPAGTVANLGRFADIPLTVAARAGKRANVTTTLTKKASKIIEKAAEDGRIILNDVGLIEGARRSVNPNNWEAFKLTNRGTSWLQGFADDTYGSAAQIWRRSGGTIPPRTAARLEKAKTLDEVVEVLDEAVYNVNPLDHVRIMPGIDPRPIVTRTGAMIKGNVTRYRPFFDTLPESTDFPLNNLSLAAKNADLVMARVEMPLDVRNQKLTELFQIFDGSSDDAIFDWLNNFERDVVAKQLRDFNWREDKVRQLTDWRGRYGEVGSSFTNDVAGSSVPLPWMLGGPNGGRGPLFLNQTLRVNPTIVDNDVLTEIADNIGPLTSRLERSRRKVLERQPIIDPDTGEITGYRNLDVKERQLIDKTLRVGEFIGDAIDHVQSRYYKPNVLVRPRYLVRTLPEEMVRVWASGVFDHNFQYLVQILTNRNSRDLFGEVIRTSRQSGKIEAQLLEQNRLVRKMLQKQANGETTYRGRKIIDILDEANTISDDLTKQLDVFDERIDQHLTGLDDALIASTKNKAMDLVLSPGGTSSVAQRGYVFKAERAAQPDIWAKGMAQRIAERSAQDYVRYVANGMRAGKPVDEIVAGLMDNETLRASVLNYVEKLGNKDPNFVWDVDGFRTYVKFLMDDISTLTMGDDVLVAALAEGKYLDEELSGARGFAQYRGRKNLDFEPNEKLQKYIRDNHLDNPQAPEMINYFPSLFDKDPALASTANKVKKFYDGLLSMFFDGMYGMSSDKLSRNPLWQQAKWQRVVELVPLMDPKEAQLLVDSLSLPAKTSRFGLSTIAPTIIEDIKELAPTAVGEATRKDIQQAAEWFATRFTKENMFDASRKTKFGASHRKMFLFYDAFVELSGSAMKLATNPKVIHKADVILGELRQNTFMLGTTDVDGDGKKESFLYRDPVSGDEMFAFSPPPGFLKEWRKLGLDFRVGNTLNSLSLITTPYPSLGPMVAVPLNKMIPDRTEFDKLREIIAPYGVPDLSSSDILPFLVPGYGEQMNRILGSSGVELFTKMEDRQKVTQSILRGMTAAAAVKDYDPYTPGQQGPTGEKSLEQWQADGIELGTKAYGITGWAGLFLPGAPIAQWTAKTKFGNVLFGVLTERWRKIDEEGDKTGLDYQDKLDTFVKEIGNEALVALLQPVTDRSIVGSTSTKEFQDWYRDNKDVADRHDRVSGYFSPRSSDMDPQIWSVQRLNGDVKYKDPAEFAKNVESAWANFQFNKVMRQFEAGLDPNLDPKDREDRIKAASKELAKSVKVAYPNWDRASAATAAKQERSVQLAQVREMIQEPSLQDNPVVVATKEYLAFQKANVDYVRARDPKIDEENWKSMAANKRAVALREAMWAKGEELAERYPDFVNLWQNVLSRDFLSVEVGE